MKRFLLFILISVFYIGFINAQNKLPNGDFESWDDDNTPTSWTHVENITKDATTVHGGSYSAKHVGGTKDLGQTITLVPGKKYKFTVWYNVESGDGEDARLWCVLKDADGNADYDNTPGEIRGPDGGYLSSGNFNEWLKYETVITIPDNLPQLYYELRTYKGATVYWDDLSIEEYISKGSVELTYPKGGEDFKTGEDVTITWTATGVDSVYIQGKKSDEEDFETLHENAIDATLGTLDFTIPTDAEEGDYQLKIVSKDDPTIADTSGLFHITDVHFAGLDPGYPFYPENGAVDVPTDLYINAMEMYFYESIKTGTGNIYLHKYSDDSVVKTFDVTDPNQVTVDPDEESTLIIYLPGNLDPDTKYYVTIDAGAVTDRAATPNACPGFTDKDTWVFTTGATDSSVSIHDIQYTTDPSGDSPLKDQVVKTKGIVMAVTGKGYYIQDDAKAWCGLYVYDTDNASIAVGDEISVIGTIVEYYGLTEMNNIAEKTVISSGNVVWDPVTITLADYGESYENVLVKVENVTCSDPDLGYGEWEITDGTNTGRVNDLMFKYTPVDGEKFTSVTGILNYNYSNFKMEPRDAADIVTAPTFIRRNDNGGLIVGPNPVMNDMRISAAMPIVRVQVLNSVGQTIKDANVSGDGVTIATGGMSKGIYLVRVTFADGTVKMQKVIKR